ncbi:MAG: ImmA/IrrE family metallo-endopeptidase [Gammaproteobacteria bacterium]|nr:ImmA/IrrE family metallo-endopeptidase [Gammaproteobacteria bacterium]MYD79508.1 ImmA/IrrE family metallo-endopeptidase [Gammaproteobacteria bacterium]
MLRVEVKPELLRWGRERAGMQIDALINRFPKYAEWESGNAQPTLKQLEKLASTVHAPIGYFFLPEPLEEPLPIPDFRTIENKPLKRPSLELLDTIDLCQRRQDWYREFALREGDGPVSHVGSASLGNDVEAVAAAIRTAISLDLEERRSLSTWTDALRRFIENVDTLGVLVMLSGIVGNNTHRKLDPAEFRGFALADDLAPLVFINGADTKAAQMFTLAHELAHLWLGESALSDSTPDSVQEREIERWCNKVAAELLVPISSLRLEYEREEKLTKSAARLARRFKVSTLVILRRIYDAGEISWDDFRHAYDAELENLKARTKGSGGNFYPTQSIRTGKRFASAIVMSTLEGRTSFTESSQLLGIKKAKTFDSLALFLGITR